MKDISSKLNGPLSLYLRWPVFAAIMFALVAVIAFFIDVRAGVLLASAVIIYTIALVILLVGRKKYLTNSLIDFASGYAQMQKKMLEEFVVPYGMLDESGRLIWHNKALLEMIGDNNSHKYLQNIFEELKDVDLLPDEDGHSNSFAITYNDRNFSLVVNKIDIEGDHERMRDDIYSVYFFDDTDIIKCRTELHNERFVTGLIYFDNYDEVMDSTEEVRRSLLSAFVDRKVNKYIANGNGIVKKLEKDKYLVVFRYKFLEQLREDRFSILEDVKTISIGNEIRVTLSIGIGALNGSYIDNYDTARTAIDLALGRGGDQAVVKEGGKVTYFGGKTNTVEKNTRVKARVKAHALRELLEVSDNVLVMGHKISDVDAIGSAVGIYAAARMFDKKAHIVLNDITSSLRPIVDLYKNNSEYEKDLFVNSEEALSRVTNNTLLVVVDVNKKSYTECPELLNKCKNVVVLDHHRQGNEPVDNAILSYIEPYASSACEMVAEILQYIADHVKIKPIEADTLYAGIVIDTNNFTNKAGARTFEAAAFIRRNGADIIRVRKLLRSDLNEYKAKADAVRKAEVYRDCYAISECTAAGLQSPTIVGAQAANELLNIAGIRASFVFTYYNDEIYISARSIDEVNVQLVMERLGGGGHMTIAGAQLKDIDMDSAIELVKTTIDKMIQEDAI